MLLKPPKGALPAIGHPFTKGLVGCWLMNEGGGDTVYDLSGNGSHGNIVNDVFYVPGKFGSALDFPASDDHVDTIPFLRSGTGFSISIWVKIRDASVTLYNGHYYSAVASKRAGVDKAWQLMFYDDVLQSMVYDGANEIGTVNDSAVMTLNTWVHYTVTTAGHNGGPLQMYRDSMLVATDTLSGSMGDHLLETVFGAASWNKTWGELDGQIDHALIYNRGLTAGEIAQLHREPFCMFEVDL